MIHHVRAPAWSVNRKPLNPPPPSPPCASELLALASAVGRLSPSHRDPERYHLDKSEIVAELRRLANVWGRTSVADKGYR